MVSTEYKGLYTTARFDSESDETVAGRYYGPVPPPGRPHRYFFKLYALDEVLGLKPRATAAQVLTSFSRHVLTQATLMGTYQR